MDGTVLRIPLLQDYIKYCYGDLMYDENTSCPESTQMRSDWSSLPLLALKNVLGYLDRQDALAAMSTCRHWRTALLMYEDSMATLKLGVNDIERSLFLTRIFRKQTKRLIVQVNTTDEDQLEKFMNVVISLFHDSKLYELVFVGNSYLNQNARAITPQLPRAPVEGIIYHLRSLKRFALMGCKLSSAKNKNLHIKNSDMTKKQRTRMFKTHPLPCDTVLSRCNSDLMMYSGIQAMVLDYELINTECLETLSELKCFRWLTMVVRDRPHFTLEPVDWLRLQTVYSAPLNVTVCMLQLSAEKIEEVMDNVFVQGLRLVSLKAIFCKTMHMGAIIQVSNMYSGSLQEFVWTDAPQEPADAGHRSLKTVRLPELNMCHVNPLILLCWQCTRLKRVVIHGYWVWQYDAVGMARLRRGLHLELSAVAGPRGRAARRRAGVARVHAADPHCDAQAGDGDGEGGWRPVPRGHLHPALRASATREHRADYVMMETRTPLGLTYPYSYWRPRYYEYLVPTSTYT